MRHESCLNCRHGAQAGTPARLLTGFAESIAPDMHHHHAVKCEDCLAWWFDDAVIGGLGIPVSSRRDTVMCDCPEDGADRFTQIIIQVPVPEKDCRCDAAEVRRHAVDIRLGGAA